MYVILNVILMLPSTNYYNTYTFFLKRNQDLNKNYVV